MKNTFTKSAGLLSSANSWFFLALLMFGAAQLETFAQTSKYTYGTSAGTYTAITGTTYQSGAALSTDAVSGDIPLGFTFRYNRKDYTNIRINNNGYIIFGPNSGFATTTTGITGPGVLVEGTVSGFATNLVASTAASPSIIYGPSGSDFVVQYTDMARSGQTADRITFQIRLTQTTNVIRLVYGTCSATTGTTNFPQVGIRGAGSRDYQSIGGTTATTWSAPTVTVGTGGAALVTSMRFTSNATTPAAPTSGRTFTYTPPAELATPTYATLPTSENFNAAPWVDGNAISDLPALASWRAWPAFAERCWRRNDVAAGTTASGWSNTTGGYSIASPASGGAARFHSYQISAGGTGYMDWYVDLSPAGLKTLTFDYINVSGTDNLTIRLSTDGGATFGSVLATYGVDAAWASKSIGLTSASASTCVVRFEATSDFGANDIGVDNVSIATPPSCTPPTALTVTPSSATAVAFSWTAASPAPGVGYEWEIRSSGAAGSGPAGLVDGDVTGSPAILSDVSSALSANTAYTLYVRSDCNGTDFSPWASLAFTTPCSSPALPYTQAFTTAYSLAPTGNPSCWREATGTLNLSGNSTVTTGTNNWSPTSAFANATANNAFKINLYGTNNAWVITEPFLLSGGPKQLSYNMAVTSYNGTVAQSTLGTHAVRVIVSTDFGATWNSANIIKTYTGAGSYSNTGSLEAVSLAAYAGQTIQIAFVASTNSTSPDIDFHIDDISIANAPTCFPVTGIAVTPALTTASFSWVAPTSGTPVNYNWEIRTSGAAGSGAVGLFSSGSTTAPTVTASETGLSSSTVYTLYVQTDCGAGDVSSWTSSSFTTLPCIPVYTSGKTSGDLISDIQILGTTLANNSGLAETNPAFTFFTGAANLTATLNAGTSYTVQVSIGTWGSQGVAAWIDYNDNGIFETPSERIGTATIAAGQGFNVAGYPPATFPISLSCSPPVGNHRMRVRIIWLATPTSIDPCASGGFGETEDYIVTVAPAPPCPEPSAGIITGVTGSTADLDWQTGCLETVWDVHITTPGGGAPSGAASNPGVTAHPYTPTGLSPLTSYEYWVRANCGGSQSSYVGPYTFTTGCADQAVPFSEDFSGTFLPTCWDNQPNVGTDVWTSSTASVTGTGSALFNAYSISAGDAADLILPTTTAVPAGYAVNFSSAHAPYTGTEVENLEIYASSDGGTSYTLVTTLVGGVGGSLTSATPTSSAYVPSASDWKTRSIPIPAGTNKVKIRGISDFGNNIYVDNAGVGPEILNEAGLSTAYMYGSVPVTFGTNQVIQVVVSNNGNNSWTKNVSLNITGANTFSNTQSVTLAAGATTTVSFAAYTPTATGSNTVTITVPADIINTDNSLVLTQDITTNFFSYKYPGIANDPLGVGFNGGTGDFVALFTTAVAAQVNEVKVDFTTAGQPYNIGIWSETAGAPGTLLYTSPTLTTGVGTSFVPVPNVAVTGNFFVGVMQTGTTNLAFATQTETPIRSGAMFFQSPTGSSTWQDFAAINGTDFRFAIAAQFFTPTPPNCAINLNNTVCAVNPVTLTWASGGGAPTGYDVYFGTSSTPPLVSSNQAGTTYNAGVNPAGTYYWRVVPVNTYGAATCPTVSSFTTNLAQCYCVPTMSGTLRHMSAFSAGSIAYANPTAIVSPGYLDETLLQTNLTLGTPLPFTITNTSASTFAAIYIDFNDDGDFADAFENVFTGGSALSITGNLFPDFSVAAGVHRMRVRIASAAVTDPCANLTGLGETVDFSVNVIVPPCLPPTGLVASGTTTSTSGSVSWTPSATTAYNVYFSTSITAPTSLTTPSLVLGGGVSTANITGLLRHIVYYVWVRKDCGVVDGVSEWTGPVQIIPGTSSSLYSSGVINSEYSATTVTSATASTCPGTQSITIPANHTVSSVTTTYQMTGNTAGNGWMSEQRSVLYSPTTSTASSVASGTGNSAGTFSYNRTGLTLANGATGPVSFELRAFRTFGTTPACGTNYNFVNDDSWRVTGYYLPVRDLEFVGVVAPVAAGTCFNNAMTVTVRVRNAGSNALISGSILASALTVTTPGGPVSVASNFTLSSPLAPNATLDIPAGVLDMSTPGSYSFDGAVNMFGDLYTPNNTLTTPYVLVATPTLTPSPSASVGFEVADASFELGAAWSTYSGTLDNTYGGTISAHGGTRALGYDASLGINAAARRAISPCINLTADCYRATFWAAVHASALVTDPGIRVRVSTDQGATFSGNLNISDITTGKGMASPTELLQYSASAPSLVWRKYEVSLSGYSAGSTIRLAFVGSGSGPASLFFLDDLVVEPKIASDLQVVGVKSTIQGYSTCDDPTMGVVVRVRNNGCGSVSGFQVRAQISGAVVNSPTSLSITAGALAEGQELDYNLGSIFTFKSGSVDITGEALLTGDLVSGNNSAFVSIPLKTKGSISLAVAPGTNLVVGNSATVTASSALGVASAYFGDATVTAIPDNNITGVTSIVDVGAIGLAANSLQSVRVTIDHPHVGDLRVQLRKGVTTIDLINQRGGAGRNFYNTILGSTGAAISGVTANDEPYSADYISETAFSTFSAAANSANGAWELIVTDLSGEDVGSLVSWSMSFPNALSNSALACPDCIAGGYPVPTTGVPFGSTYAPGSYTVTQSATDRAGCFLEESQTINFFLTNVWLGTTAGPNNWFVDGNWASSPGPNDPAFATVAATISGNTPYQPSITGGTANVGSVSYTNGGSLTFGGSSDALNVKANWTGTTSSVSGVGKVVFNVTGVQNITGNTVFNNIEIAKTGATGSVEIGGNATVTGLMSFSATNTRPVNITTGNLILFSDASGTGKIGPIPAGTTFTGDVTTQRYVPGTNDGWFFLGSPALGQTFTDYSDNFKVYGPSSGFGAQGGGIIPIGAQHTSIFEYVENQSHVTLDTAQKLGWRAPGNTTIESGRGYRVWLDRSSMFNTNTLDNVGPIATGTVTFPALTRSTNVNCQPNIGPATVACVEANWGWNLLSNPLPAPLNWDATSGAALTNGWEKPANMNNAFYTWNSALGGYRVYLGTVGTAGALATGYAATSVSDNIIPSSQGFMVKVLSGTTATLKVREAAKFVSNSGAFVRTAAQNNNQIRIRLSNSNQADYRYDGIVRFDDEATFGFDANRDAHALAGGAYEFSMIDESGAELLINSVPVPSESKVIPVSMNYKGTTGMYTFNFEDLENLDNGVELYLRDNLLGNLVSINAQPQYSFYIGSGDAGVSANRFEIVVSPSTLTGVSKMVDGIGVGVYPNPASPSSKVTVSVQGVSSSDAQIIVTDMVGRVVYNGSMNVLADKVSEKNIEFDFASGVYSVKVITSGKTFVDKLIVR